MEQCLQSNYKGLQMDNIEEIIKYTKRLKLLYVEDEIDSRAVTYSILSDFFDDIIIAVDGKDGLEKYIQNANDIDLVITDLNMPILNGLDMIEKIKEINKNTTIVIFSALEESKYFIESIRQNVKGYVIKPLDLDQLIDVLECVKVDLQFKVAQEKLKKEKDELENHAYYDILTGLPNRMLFDDRIAQAIKKAKRNTSNMGIFFIDLNKFKSINDTYGHDVGDFVLNIVGCVMKSCMREEDTLSRIGGDEFTVIMEDISKPQDTMILANKILDALHQPINYKGNKLSLSASIGISVYPSDAEDASELLKYADTAMYEAKNLGDGKIIFHSNTSSL